MKPEKKVKKTKVSKKKGNKTLLIGVVAIILLAGIAYAVLSKDVNTGNSTKQPTALKDVRAMIDKQYGGPGREATNTPPVVDGYIPILSPKAAGKFPDYVYTNPMTLKAYTYATEHPEVLEQIPCYCNCGVHGSEMSGGKPHRFLRDCFINDNGEYDDHASYCDVCVGETLMAEKYFPTGLPNSAAGSGIPTATTLKTSSVDLSALSLPDNFKSLADGLKLTPAGASRAYFVNTKMLTGTELEAKYVTDMTREDAFYGKKVIGMYSADFGPTSWVELHDLGYDNTKDATLKAHMDQGMKNIVYTRPLIYGHTQNVDNIQKLMSSPTGMSTSYQTYKPLLDAVDYQNAGVALVMNESNKFSDINYWSVTPVNGKAELVKAYNITDSKSIPAALNKYNPQTKGNVLIIKVTGNPTEIQTDADTIDAAART